MSFHDLHLLGSSTVLQLIVSPRAYVYKGELGWDFRLICVKVLGKKDLAVALSPSKSVQKRRQSPSEYSTKWFNLETPDSDLFPRESRDRYKSISTSLSASASNSLSSLSSPSSSFSSSTGVPPLEIQVLLTIPDLNTNQVLVYLPDSSSSTSTRNRVQPTPKHVLLEKWVLEFTPRNATHRTRDRDRDGREGAEEASGLAGSSVALSTIYKHGIPLFRSLFSFLRILPAWKVAKKLKRRGLGGGPANGMSVVLRVADPTSAGGAGDILGFGERTDLINLLWFPDISRFHL
ncbi:hypothetical protein K435DRAFT_877757 [Dendrothele bispora CBS 962.96]|uniref:Autophagy-related protein 13 n=1 Tax=Dendrothele bispora (strain CBS 962.96) TaxID=1314807 RepID=A0A4S8KPE5_DENBC|nr:hypothetical protein K435DRAFT_877757 [Dendrothele bispora CBS 962.96]